MSDNTQVDSQEKKLQEFVKEYQKLCKRHGLQIVAVPLFKPRDDGSWSVVTNLDVAILPKQDGK